MRDERGILMPWVRKEGKEKRGLAIYCSGGYGGPLVLVLLIQLVGGYA